MYTPHARKVSHHLFYGLYVWYTLIIGVQLHTTRWHFIIKMNWSCIIPFYRFVTGRHQTQWPALDHEECLTLRVVSGR